MNPIWNPQGQGYGNIYTPHAGSMIIQVQRESGLANRTIVISQRQLRALRIGLYLGGSLLAALGASWFFLASQAARVPVLTNRVATLQQEVRQVDTLRATLSTLERRFQQVQHMLGAGAAVASDYGTSHTGRAKAETHGAQGPEADSGRQLNRAPKATRTDR